MNNKEEEIDILDVETRSRAAFEEWAKLYQDRDWLIDPVKRTAMLKAREAYLDAALEYIYVCREQAEHLKEVTGKS